MLKIIFLTASIIVLLGAGCVPTANPTGSAKDSAPAWKEVAAGASRYDCPASACGSRLVMYRFDPKRFAFRFAQSNEPLTAEGWASLEANAVFVANGLFFDEEKQPTGLMISGSKTVQDRRYDYGKSGLLELAPEVRVIDTSAEKFDLKTMTEAGQSFPLLIADGKAVASFKDTQASRRTAAGNDADGNIIFAFVPEDAITFADFAKLLSSTDVKWKNVLNLDGGTSSGFSAHLGSWSETMDSIARIPNVIIAESK